MHYLITVAVSLISFFSYKKQPGCNHYKTGKFKLVDLSIKDSFIIERSDSLQIETDLASGEISKFKVEWIDDCAYRLTALEGPEMVLNFYKGKHLYVKIIQSYDDGYKFEAAVEGTAYKRTQILKKI